jgi:hypothetical protein
MKVSGFTFLRNAHKLGYPFIASIRSILPVVDEFIVALGPSEDDTEEQLRALRDPKLRILPTQWNERIRSDYSVKGYVYGQQKTMALFNCTGDWAFYLEGDEVVHEDELPRIRAAMEQHLNDPRVEALAFDYLHFYGNANTYAWSPAWYRTEARIIRNTIPGWGPEGLFFVILETHKRGRYPRAAHTGARIYHYGWVKTENQMDLKRGHNARFWGKTPRATDYSEIDPQVLRAFTGTHPKVVQNWLPPAEGVFQANPNHRLTSRERRHRLLLLLEKYLGWRHEKRHYKLIA